MEQSAKLAKPARKPKVIHALDSPYSSVQWPTIGPSEQVDILDLLCSLLAPIGDHRRQHMHPSKGRRHRKRKRKDENSQEPETKVDPTTISDLERPVYPDLQNFLTVGFNSTNRHLELLVKASPQDNDETTGQESSSWMSAVFVPRLDQPSALNAHLPLFVKMASVRSPLKPPIYLVSLPKAAEQRLSTCLHTPRAGIVGLLDGAPGAEGLLGLVKGIVPAVEVPWLQEATSGIYMPVAVKTIETSAPVVQKRKRPPGPSNEQQD